MSVRALCSSSEPVCLQPSSCTPSLVRPRSRMSTCLPTVRPALTSPVYHSSSCPMAGSERHLRFCPHLPKPTHPAASSPASSLPSLLVSGADSPSPHSVGRQGKQRGRREGPGVQGSDSLSLAHSGRMPSTGTVTRSRPSRPITTHVATTRPALPAMTALPVGLPSPTMTGTS